MSKPCCPIGRYAWMRDSAQEGLFVFVSGVEPIRKSCDSYLQPASSAAPPAATPAEQVPPRGAPMPRGVPRGPCDCLPSECSTTQRRLRALSACQWPRRRAMAPRMRTYLARPRALRRLAASAIAAEPPTSTPWSARVKTALEPAEASIRQLNLSISGETGGTTQWSVAQARKVVDGQGRILNVLLAPAGSRGIASMTIDGNPPETALFVPWVRRVRTLIPGTATRRSSAPTSRTSTSASSAARTSTRYLGPGAAQRQGRLEDRAGSVQLAGSTRRSSSGSIRRTCCRSNATTTAPRASSGRSRRSTRWSRSTASPWRSR